MTDLEKGVCEYFVPGDAARRSVFRSLQRKMDFSPRPVRCENGNCSGPFRPAPGHVSLYYFDTNGLVTYYCKKCLLSKRFKAYLLCKRLGPSSQEVSA